MVRQQSTQRFRDALVEQYAHLRGSESAACRMVQYRADLFKRDAGKPLHELRRDGAVLKVLKKR